jgi:hypothetical protein
MTYHSLSANLNEKVSSAIKESLLGLAKKYSDKSVYGAIAHARSTCSGKGIRTTAKASHLGAQIGINVAGRNLDDRKIDIVWRKLIKRDVPLFIHPPGDRATGDRLKDYCLDNFIGNPLESSICTSSLIFGGVFDLLPDINFSLSLTGYFAPWIRGRW